MRTRAQAGARPAQAKALLGLTAAAVITRLIWVLWLHPPGDYVFRDMRSYLVHAQWLVEHGLEPWPAMAFQPPGTSLILALPLWIFGADALVAAALTWALLAAAAVPLTFVLAREVGSRPWLAPASATAVLLWYPSLSYAGLFTSETPYCAALLLACWRLAVLARTGRGALGAGLACALAFLIRPQFALALALILALLGLGVLRRSRARSPGDKPDDPLSTTIPPLRWSGLLALVLPVLLTTVATSAWVRHQVGRRAGLTASSGTLNLALARCHLTRIQAFQSTPAMIRSHSLEDGRVVGAPSLWSLHQRFPDPEQLYALRPAFGSHEGRTTIALRRGGGWHELPVRVAAEGLAIKYVGARDDRIVHRALIRECRARTTFAGQLRYGVQNLSLLVAFNPQWPDSHRGRERWRRLSDPFVWIFALLILPLALLGLRAALAQLRARPGRGIVALQLVGLIAVAAVVFGSIRIRVPHDPLWWLLAFEGARVIARAISPRARPARPAP